MNDDGSIERRNPFSKSKEEEYNALDKAWRKTIHYDALHPAERQIWDDKLKELDNGNVDLHALHQFIKLNFKDSEQKRTYAKADKFMELSEKRKKERQAKESKEQEEKFKERSKEAKEDEKIKKEDEIKERILKAKAEGNTSHYVITLIALKKRSEATETIAKMFLKNEKVYTTRDDERSECWIYKEGIYVPQARTYIRECCRNLLKEVFTGQLANEIISKIEADTYIDQEDFFKEEPPNLIAVKNGILDLNTKELKPFDPNKKFFSKLSIDYIPNKKCKSIKDFFDSLFKNKEEVKVIQEIFGFLLYKEYFLEKAIMMLGSGRNGKGKTLELMKRFIGVENCAEISLESMEKDIYGAGELFKKSANLCGDLSKGALKHTGEFKKLTGRDLLSAPRKFKTRVQFVNYAKMIFSCNELPYTYDITEAFFNRWLILDFPFTFLPQQEIDLLDDDENIKLRDPNIIDKISTEEEMEGLLNWAIEGLDRLRDKKSFSFSPSTEETKNKWMRKSNSCLAFVMDYVEENPEGYVIKSDFKRFYTAYCREHKIQIASEKVIKNILTTVAGADEDRRKIDEQQKYIWCGIRIKEEEPIIKEDIEEEVVI